MISVGVSDTFSDLYLALYKIMRHPFDLYKKAKLEPAIEVDIDISNNSKEVIYSEAKKFLEKEKIFGFYSNDLVELEINNK